jgi:hypothetical protein
MVEQRKQIVDKMMKKFGIDPTKESLLNVDPDMPVVA